MKTFRKAGLAAFAAFVLGAGFSASSYAEYCPVCMSAFRACYAATGDVDACYFEYERCMYRTGCG